MIFAPKSGERGSSMLGGLVVVAVLGTLAISLDSLNTPQASPEALTAAAASTESTDVKDYPKDQVAQCSDGRSVTIRYACAQEAPIGEIEKLEQTCTPGFAFGVNIADKKITVQPVPAGAQKSLAGCTVKPPPKCTSGNEALSSTSDAKCQVTYCHAGKCSAAVGDVQGKLLGEDNFAKGISDLTSELTDEQFTSLEENLGALSENFSTGVNKAFSDQIGRTEQELAAAEKVAKEAQARVNDSSLSFGERAEAQRQLEAAQLRAQELEEQKGRLASLEKRLSPEDTPKPDGTEKPGSKETETQGPGLTPPDTFSQNPPGGRNPLGQMQQPGGGQSSQGNQNNPFNNQNCQGRRACNGNAIYEYDRSCQQRFVRNCQNGCSSNTQCRENTQQCPAQQPPQPNADECKNGSWRATYTTHNGRQCITGWRCTDGTGDGGGSGDGPIAELSCQPEVADVGTELTISYSCSEGEAEGSGFSTDNEDDDGDDASGSTTVVIAEPPAGTNTATYTLTCRHEGRSSTDSCSIQIGKPAVALVANPASVQSGQPSSIGWVTSGMESCTISSPDLSGFTSENEFNESTSGAVTTPELTSSASFTLRCATVGGVEIDETVLVTVEA